MPNPLSFNIFRRNSFDYLKLDIYFPKIGVIRETSEWTDTIQTTYTAEFPTDIKYTSDRCILDKSTEFWYLGVRLVGFGIGLTRQSGY